MSDSQLPRLADSDSESPSAPRALRDALRGARAAGPDAAQAAALEARLLPLLQPGAGGAPAPDTATPAGAPTAAIGIGAGLLLAAVVGVLALRGPPAGSDAGAAAPQHAEATAVVARPGASIVAPAADPSPVSPAPAPAEPRATPSAAASAASAASSTATPAVTGGHATSTAPTAAATDDDFTMIAHAQALLSSDPAGALTAATEHQQRFPRSRFAEEREVIRIDALARTGRAAEARARAAAFLERAPQSAYRRRVEAAVGGP